MSRGEKLSILTGLIRFLGSLLMNSKKKKKKEKGRRMFEEYLQFEATSGGNLERILRKFRERFCVQIFAGIKRDDSCARLLA